MQTFPRALNEFICGDNSSTYLVVGDLRVQLGAGLNFINGYAFLERFYSVYDTTYHRVGNATTENTNSTANYDSYTHSYTRGVILSSACGLRALQALPTAGHNVIYPAQ